MNKILRYFPLNKKIQKKDVKSLLITVGIYVAVLVAFLIVKKILVPVKIIGTLVYNFSKLYNLYAVAGIILGVITCFTNIDTEEVNYITVEDIKNLYMSDKKKIAWIVTGVAVLAAAIITPTGLKAERLKRAVDKYVAEDHSSESVEEVAEEVEEEEPEVLEEEVEEVIEVEEEAAFAGPLYERFVPGEELGTYHDDETGTNFVIYDNGAVYSGGSVNDVLRIPAYLVFGDERYEVKAIADMTEESTWIREVYIPNTITTIGYSCFSNCDDLKKVHMGNSVTYIGEFSFSDSPVGEVHLPLSVYEIGEGAFGKYNKNYARVRVSSEEQAHHLRLQQPDYLQVGVYDNLEFDEIEDIELSAVDYELKKPKKEDDNKEITYVPIPDMYVNGTIVSLGSTTYSEINEMYESLGYHFDTITGLEYRATKEGKNFGVHMKYVGPNKGEEVLIEVVTDKAPDLSVIAKEFNDDEGELKKEQDDDIIEDGWFLKKVYIAESLDKKEVNDDLSDYVVTRLATGKSLERDDIEVAFAIGNTYQDFADYYGDNRTEASGYIQYYIKNPNGWYYEITIRNNEKQTTPSDVMSEVPVRSVDFKIHPITEGLYALNE